MNKIALATIKVISILALLTTQTAQADEKSLEQRLQILEDKDAIRTLLLNYGRHLDNREWEKFSALFVEDSGSWNGGMGIATGKAQIIDMMVSTIGTSNAGSNGSGLSNLHLLGNEFVDVDGDKATALSKWVFVMTAEEGGPEAVFVGHYSDQLVRIDGQWYFQERVVHGDIMSQATAESLNNQ